MSIKPKKWDFYAQYNSVTGKLNWNPKQLVAICEAFHMKAVRITIEEVVEWDIAPMRKFLHGVILPAFVRKFTETCAHPNGGKFTTELVKRFLKFRYLGFEEGPAYRKWRKALQLDRDDMDIFAFIDLEGFLRAIKDVPEIRGTENLEPVVYWEFLSHCEAYFHELFHDMWDKRTMPVKPKGNQS